MDQQNYPVKNKVPAKLPNLEGEMTYSKFKTWKESWNDYCKLARVHGYARDEQRALLRSCFDIGVRTYINKVVGICEEDDLTIDEILDKISKYLRGKQNIAVDRVAFLKRKQENGENFDSFYMELNRLAEDAELCKTCGEEQIATKIMSAIRSEETKKKLLAMTPFPSLQTVVNICRADETATNDNK